MGKTFLAMQKSGDLHSAFHEFGEGLGHSKEHVNDLLRSLPIEIKRVDVLSHPGESDLSYIFADPFAKLPDNGMVFGGPQVTPIRALYWAAHSASLYMNSEQRAKYLDNLGNSAKHLDYLFEARPFLGLTNLKTAQNEVPGDGAKTIDWLLQVNGARLFIDCKFRTTTAVANFKEMIVERRQSSTAPIRLPITEPEKIFKDAEKKFRKSESGSLNGVWISSVSGENESLLVEYFENSLNPEKVQFFILSGWGPECFLLTRSDEQKQFLLAEFGLVECDRLTFRDDTLLC